LDAEGWRFKLSIAFFPMIPWPMLVPTDERIAGTVEKII
jgi:hypothetical protein